MASSENPPPAPTEDFAPPPSDDDDTPNSKEVSWSATPKENEREMIEKRKFPVRYDIPTNNSIKHVLKATHTMFLGTDPTFRLISKEDPSIVIRNATELDKFSAEEMKRYFPGVLIKSKTCVALFMVTDRSLHRLKKESPGFYTYASKQIYISKNPFLSSDVRNVGFFLRKSAEKVDKEKFTTTMTTRLSDFPLSHADSDRYNEAKEKLPFDGPLPTFELRSSSHIYHSNSNGGQVRTTAITFHCDQQHSSFLSRLLIRYYETQEHPLEQFVPHSLLHGNDSTNQRAYRNAIILQNKYLLAMRILPVIGISPKALEQEVSVFGAPNQTVENLLLQYKLFSSIEPTSKSDELGLHFFVTTSENFDKAKDFIIETVPKIWAKLDNTFLSELPSSVKVPRLTTSNLKDSATTRTAALLANAIESDDATIASKWSNAPKLNRPPTTAVIVNYSDVNFPPMVSSKKSRKKHTPKSHEAQQTARTQDQALDSSVHSKVSATSAGTTFTREDGVSLFTSLTESFMSDMKSQSEAMMAMVDQQKIDRHADRQAHKEEQRQQKLEREEAQRQLKNEREEERAEQRRLNAQTDAKFMQMLQAFTQQTTQGIPPSPLPPPSTIVISPTAVAAPPTQVARQPPPSTLSTQPMDTAPDATNVTDPEQRPMEEDTAPASPFRYPQPDFQPSQFEFDEAAIALEQQQLAAMHAEHDSVASNSSNESLESPNPGQDAQATNGDDADDEGDSDDEDEDDDDDDEDDEESDSSDEEADSAASDTSMTPRVLNPAETPERDTPTHQVPPLPDGSDDESYSTVDKDDPTHEQYEIDNKQNKKAQPEVHSPPKVTRATSNKKATPPEDLMAIHERLYREHVPNYATRTTTQAMIIESNPKTPTRRNSASQDTDESAWTVQTGADRTPAESQALLQNQTLLHRLNKAKTTTTKPTPPRSATKPVAKAKNSKPVPGTNPKAPAQKN